MRKKQNRAKHTLGLIALLVALLAIATFGVKSLLSKPKEKTMEAGVAFLNITRDFGEKRIKSQKLSLKNGETVMDLLRKATKIEASYGGGFVSSINGLASSSTPEGNFDWFFYHNGILSGKGANEVKVEDKDYIWWDYHSWNQVNFVPAVIGAYPQPLVTKQKSGKKTMVLYSNYLESLAREFGSFLEAKGGKVSYRKTSSRDPLEDGLPCVAFITKGELSLDWVSKILSNPSGYGTFAEVSENSIFLLDQTLARIQVPGEISTMVCATATGLGDSSPLWLVICDGEIGARQAGELLITNPEQIEGRFGIAVSSDGKIFSLPMKDSAR
ncbi:MAG: DUF4430 domain-containing protein [Actinomycetota bacterium]|nr:DUF4430 domain-containing protein [Actinomycetota bacterium]